MVDGGEVPPHLPPEGDVLLLLLLHLVDAGLPHHHPDEGIYEIGSCVLVGATLDFCDWNIYSSGLVQLFTKYHILYISIYLTSPGHNKSRGREKVDWWWWPGWDGNWESWWLKTVNAVDLEQGQGYQRVAENLTLTLQLGLPYLWIHPTAGCVVLLCVFFKIHI